MSVQRLYLDWNAGAPIRAAARARLVEMLGAVGNGSSVHAEGRAARAAIEAARRSVAALVGGEPKAVTFTSGGTEAANTVLAPDWTLFGRAYRFDRLLVSAVEHPSVRRGGRFSADRVEAIPVDGEGVVDLGWLEARLAACTTAGERALVSVMLANNETGVIQPVGDVARLTRAAGGFTHTDAVQAAGRLPIDIAALGVDVLTLSAHKIGGPQGVGAIVRSVGGHAFPPLMTGGGQEAFSRAGTENAPGLAAFGVAAETARDDLKSVEIQRQLRDRIEAQIRRAAPEAVVFGGRAERLCNTVCFAVPGMAAETAVIAFDLAGVALSAGSACSSGKVRASEVLSAMGVAPDLARCGLRLSLGPTTTADEIERFGPIFEKIRADMTKRQATQAA